MWMETREVKFASVGDGGAYCSSLMTRWPHSGSGKGDGGYAVPDDMRRCDAGNHERRNRGYGHRKGELKVETFIFDVTSGLLLGIARKRDWPDGLDVAGL